MRLHFPRALVIFFSLSTCYARVQAGAVAMPDVPSEVNGCLRMVRVMASRRGRRTLPAHLPVGVRSSRRA